MEHACIALRLGGEVERYERGDVGGLAVLEDLAGPGVEVYRAGPYLVLGAGAWFDDVGAGGEGLGEGCGDRSSEGEEAHDSAHSEGLHFGIAIEMMR